ncbi:dTMP kinase [Vibrio sp. 10N.286.49.C2]|uniref:dTMP kinase n=1 Tax=unclassified Vibrio TaxID=2614977 RepID=UPI000C84BB0C|nr:MULTISPECIES: dTMP kinase [unclassified Vibrio]PMH33744.1 dTMP kinase [Vibrio sp. 10N.286.49.C2]PMH44001.1 dTMP kinase [Vibrio sp. 10N.286.49.B1]PMH78741.1 dTMP kinase [Vibrio sp. 10N.286.48.B7]
MSQAKFIVIEGLEGAGKSTAIATLRSELEKSGINHITNTREPGGTILAEKMRALVKEEQVEEALQDRSELLLMYAARIQLVETVIKPALAQGTWVIGDRHDMSSQAYQGGGRQIDQGTMHSLKKIALGDFKPDFTLYLDIDPKLGLERARGRGELDRIEKMDIGFFERTRASYLAMAESDDSVTIIDASQSLDGVQNSIQEAVQAWLNRLKE